MTGIGSPTSISLPRGETATFEEMQAYGSVLQSFIYEQEAKLPAVKDTRRHNDAVDYLQSLANGYNEQLRIYKDTEARRQRNLMAALWQAVQAPG